MASLADRLRALQRCLCQRGMADCPRFRARPEPKNDADMMSKLPAELTRQQPELDRLAGQRHQPPPSGTVRQNGFSIAAE